MKRFSIIIVFVFLIVIGCKKSDTVDNQDKKKYQVEFNVDNFKIDQFPLKGSTSQNSTETPLITKLRLYIYDAESNVVEVNDQYLDNPNFGNFQSELISGTYSIGILGYTNGDISKESNANTHFIRFPVVENDPIVSNKSTVTEVFEFGYDTVIIKSDTTFQPFNLKRVTSTLEVKILDNIPNNAGWLLISTNQDNKMRMFSKNLLVPDWNFIHDAGVYKFDLRQLKGTAGNSFKSAIIPNVKDGNNFDVYISVIDENKKGLFNNMVKNVNFKSNYLTRLTGELNSVTSKKFSINIVKEYTDTLNVIF